MSSTNGQHKPEPAVINVISFFFFRSSFLLFRIFAPLPLLPLQQRIKKEEAEEGGGGEGGGRKRRNFYYWMIRLTWCRCLAWRKEKKNSVFHIMLKICTSG